MTLRLVLAAYGLETVRPYRIGAGRNNEHWYVGAGLVLRRYGPFRSDAATDYEHAIVGQLRERGWPVAVPIPSDAGRMVVVDDGRRYSLFPRLAGRRGHPGQPRQPRELGRLLGRLHRDIAAVSVAGPPDAFPPVLEMPADQAWQRLDALDDPVLIQVSSSPARSPSPGLRYQLTVGTSSSPGIETASGSSGRRVSRTSA